MERRLAEVKHGQKKWDSPVIIRRPPFYFSFLHSLCVYHASFFFNFILKRFFFHRLFPFFLSSTFRFLTGRRCAAMRLAATIDGSVAEGPGAQFIFYSNYVDLWCASLSRWPLIGLSEFEIKRANQPLVLSISRNVVHSNVELCQMICIVTLSKLLNHSFEGRDRLKRWIYEFVESLWRFVELTFGNFWIADFNCAPVAIDSVGSSVARNPLFGSLSRFHDDCIVVRWLAITTARRLNLELNVLICINVKSS